MRFAAEHLQKNAPKGRRKVIVVISDGEDTNSDGVLKAIWDAEKKLTANIQGEELRTLRVRARDTAKVREQVRVLKSLQDADTVFYSINPGGSSLQLNKMAQFGQENLQKFADDTGGTAYLPKFQPVDTKDELANSSNMKKNTATLETIFKQLANELRAQYLIQYYSDSEFPNNKYVRLSSGIEEFCKLSRSCTAGVLRKELTAKIVEFSELQDFWFYRECQSRTLILENQHSENSATLETLQLSNLQNSRFLSLTYRGVDTYILKFGHTPEAALAQLVEHSIRNRKVVGSTPMGGSISSSV